MYHGNNKLYHGNNKLYHGNNKLYHCNNKLYHGNNKLYHGNNKLCHTAIENLSDPIGYLLDFTNPYYTALVGNMKARAKKDNSF